jgi:hypothetical protein
MDDARSGLGETDGSSLLPRCSTLHGFALDDGCDEGLSTRELQCGTTLVIRTRNSEYRLVVLDGPSHKVLARGGLQLPEPTEAYLQGSSAGGSFVKIGWIGVGLRLEFIVGQQRIVTSRVQSIAIENVPPRLRAASIPA